MRKIYGLVTVAIVLASTTFAQSEFEFTNFNSTTTPVLNGNNFKSVAVAKAGQIWVGSQYHGLIKYDPVLQSWTASSDLLDVLINDITYDERSGVWISQSGRSGLQSGGSNTAGGVNHYPTNNSFSGMSFYSITLGGGLTSRNARSIWVDKYHTAPDGSPRVWTAQGTYVTANTTTAGGISSGVNTAANFFTKVFNGLQVTPYVPAGQTGLPNCLTVTGNRNEVWVFATANFGRSQILRYSTNAAVNTFLGAYDYTNTPVLTSGFRANAMYFDDQDRGWIGLSQDGIRVKVGGVWKTMNDLSIFPSGTAVNPNAITSDQNGFVYIGTSSGLVIYRGGAIDSASSYKRVTMTDGLPTNNINGVAADSVNKRMILAHDAGISFMKFKTKVDARLDWDFSFPKPAVFPKGVVADGVSRLYVKVKRNNNTLLPIKKIALSINKAASQAISIIGKVKVATVLNEYSNEANTGTSLEASRTDSTSNGDFNFWYVAPDNFSADSLSREASMSERKDSIKIKITYNDNSEDSTYLSVMLQRPPVMVASMLTRAKDLITKLKLPDNTPLVQSDKFVHKISVQLKEAASTIQNIASLIEPEALPVGAATGTLQGMLQAVHGMGYAAARIDFVGQGLAANVMRAAQAAKAAVFFADGGQTYNNYGKGYLNKFIAINAPFNGTPYFDLLYQAVPRLNQISQKAISALEQNNTDSIQPYKFTETIDSILSPIKNLLDKGLFDSNSFKLPLTMAKNHLIVSDADAVPTNPELEKIYGGGLFGRINQELLMILRDIAPPDVKDTLTKVFSQTNTFAKKAMLALDKFAELKGVTNFTGDGDLIAPVSSQTAGQLIGLSNISKIISNVIGEKIHDGTLTGKYVGAKVNQLLNTGVESPAFSPSIPANAVAALVVNGAQKISKLFYDTSKIVTDDRQIISNSSYRQQSPTGVMADTTIRLKFRVKDTAKLQYIFINFQDTMYTTTSKARNQEIMLKIKNNMQFSGIQEITAVGVYETADSIKYHADTIKTFVKEPDSLRGFRITQNEFDLYDGIPFYPSYEVLIRDEWQPLKATDTAIKIIVEYPATVAYDGERYAFDATSDGFSRAYFTYKTYKDTVSFNALLGGTVVNRTIATGNFKTPAIWSLGRAPRQGDSVVISAGNTVVLDSTVQVRSLRIDSLGTLTLNNATRNLQLGGNEDGEFMLDNYGTLNISNGLLTVKGRVKHNRGSRFNMTGGNLVIDGNTGLTVNSLENGLFLFEAAPVMQSFSFTGGTLQIIDPPIGVASQALSCAYSFGPLSTLILGNGISVTASNSPTGFGGSQFPAQIGKLVLDGGTGAGNRQLTITKPLNVKGSFEIRTGSNLNLQAEMRVTQ